MKICRQNDPNEVISSQEDQKALTPFCQKKKKIDIKWM